MARTILSVGFEVPGGETEFVNLLSKRSLLDADIVIFSPEIPYTYGSESYLGKTCLSDDASFRVREALAHWRRELAATVDAGKLVVVLLKAPEVVYAATGRNEYSGTGRNTRTTRMVEELHAYGSIPVKWQFREATGREMALIPEARFFSPYWTDFGKYSRYELYLEGDVKEAVVKTKTGNRTVGSCIRKGRGALLAVPALDLADQPFIKTRKVEGKEESYWTKEAQIFGRQFASTLVALAETLASEGSVTPPPDWTHDDIYRVPEETSIELRIKEVTEEILKFEEQQRALEIQLEDAGGLRRLLFEQGKPLEHAVLQALRCFGFDATGFEADGSEFDAVFTSPEGRFIGEAEGKDSKAINIDKFSQLERNLSEDFAREGVDRFAKGVLFGNAYRLLPLADRENFFTEKCRTAAVRLGVALVRTPDLFAPSRYLKSQDDSDYAKRCREAILATVGDIVVFPDPPANSVKTEHSNATNTKAS